MELPGGQRHKQRNLLSSNSGDYNLKGCFWNKSFWIQEGTGQQQQCTNTTSCLMVFFVYIFFSVLLQLLNTENRTKASYTYRSTTICYDIYQDGGDNDCFVLHSCCFVCEDIWFGDCHFVNFIPVSNLSEEGTVISMKTPRVHLEYFQSTRWSLNSTHPQLNEKSDEEMLTFTGPFVFNSIILTE